MSYALLGGYPYMEDLMKLDACQSPQPIVLPQEMQEIWTPLHWQEWDRALEGHPDQRFRRYVVEGIKHGFRIGYDYRSADQLKSAPMKLRGKDTPILEGKMFSSSSCSWTHVIK